MIHLIINTANVSRDISRTVYGIHEVQCGNVAEALDEKIGKKKSVNLHT